MHNNDLLSQLLISLKKNEKSIISILCKQILLHYGDVIMSTISSQITSLTVVYSTDYSDADQRKHQSSASLAFVRGIHRDRWIPRTKGQLRGKCFHLMTSSCCTKKEFVGRWVICIVYFLSNSSRSAGWLYCSMSSVLFNCMPGLFRLWVLEVDGDSRIVIRGCWLIERTLCYNSVQYLRLHMPLPQSTVVVACKIVKRSLVLSVAYSETIFALNLNCEWEIFGEMGPRPDAAGWFSPLTGSGVPTDCPACFATAVCQQ